MGYVKKSRRHNTSRCFKNAVEERIICAMATDAITLHLPDDLYHRLERLASLTRQPLEGLIIRTLSSNLPPLPDDLSPATRDTLQALEHLSNDDLWHTTNATMPTSEYERLTTLREQRHERTLTTEEQAELDTLMQAADLLTLQKAYAAVLLKWRGQQLPPVSAMPYSSDIDSESV
jgi:hypothetical protein